MGKVNKSQERHVRISSPKKREESPDIGDCSFSWTMFLTKLVIPIAVILIATFYGFKGYYETRVNTPFSHEKLVDLSRLNKSDYYWGSYRPNVYFGMKTREPHSLVTGLMWYFPEITGLRHWCTQENKLQKYGWTKHDGKNFGIQEIVDKNTLIKTTFVKNIHGSRGGDWTSRIRITSLDSKSKNQKISLLYYTAIEEKTNGNINPVIDTVKEGVLNGVEGETSGLGYFNLNFKVLKGTSLHKSYLITHTPNLSKLEESLSSGFIKMMYEDKGVKKVVFGLPNESLIDIQRPDLPANFIVNQIIAEMPFELEVSFKRNSMMSQKENLTGKRYEDALENHERNFDQKFEEIFKLKEKGYNESDIDFAKLSFSNMIGSVGYFYGSSQVKSIHTEAPVPYWKAPLFSAVPSRSFFPRGFLWDEGFHGLLLSSWNLDLEMDIISHWFDLMNIEGWIPREMILGEEALAKVPQEFVTQINTNANPPTFFLTLQFILDRYQDEFIRNHLDLLEKLYPRLQTWFTWFNTTQKGTLPSTYRWRGRNSETNIELNPKTLTSGLDDYPRASHPTTDERHIDLRCWMAVASKVMATIADILGKPSNKYLQTYKYLSDNELLNKLHWSEKTNSYADYGLHSDKVVLERPKRKASRHNQMPPIMQREVLEKPEIKFVDTAFGYVSLFPLITRLIDPQSTYLKKILDDILKTDFLWTDYGLRSLAKSSPLYMQRNTEHDPPYWRGAIWMNLNYLTVSALHYYSNEEGPYQNDAARIYTKLRENLIKNVINQYNRTGYIWEHYDDTTGKGKGSHPFTGWSSLTLLLMAEIY